MALRITRKGVIIFVLLIVFIAVGLGGYLAWKVNNEANLGNTNSSAGGQGYPFCPCKCAAGDQGVIYCDAIPGVCEKSNVVCGNAARCHCCDGNWVIALDGNCDNACKGNGGVNKCDEPPKTNDCTCSSFAGCGVNCQFPAGTPAKVDAAAAGTCGRKMAFCVMDSDGNTKVEIRDPGDCWAQKDVCKNPTAEETCAPGVCQGDCGTGCPTGLTCTGGKCINPSCPSDADCTCATYTCNSACTTNSDCSKISPNYQCITGKCRDARCPTATNCQCNSAWTINKSAAVVCINENTPQVASKVTYTISITFNSNGQTGIIGGITDTFTASPVPVQASWISSIDNGGVVSGNGLVTWTLTGAAQTFSVGQTRTFSFVMTVPGAPYNEETDSSPQFGTYSNSVFADVLSPDRTKDLNVARTILVGCRVPSTGLFDTALSKIILAIMLLIVGILYFTVDQFESIVVNMISTGTTAVKNRITPKVIEATQIKKARKDFEKRMTKGS